MGKKKKSKKSVALSNIKILKSGKIKFSKDNKIDVSTFVQESINDVVISRLDSIISKEDVIIEPDEVKRELKSYLVSPMDIAEISSLVSSSVQKTIVIPVDKRDALDIFDFLDGGVMGEILRTSTFASIYKKVKKQWKDLCKKDNSHFTNVLYVPKVMVFLDERTGKIKNQPFYINVLIVATPPAKYMVENCMEEIDDEDIIKRYVSDLISSSVKCGCKDIILDPYSTDVLLDNISLSTEIWMRHLSDKVSKENFNSMSFSLPDQNLFISFEAQLNKLN